jgi:hypothetical protein
MFTIEGRLVLLASPLSGCRRSQDIHIFSRLEIKAMFTALKIKKQTAAGVTSLQACNWL